MSSIDGVHPSRVRLVQGNARDEQHEARHPKRTKLLPRDVTSTLYKTSATAIAASAEPITHIALPTEPHALAKLDAELASFHAEIEPDLAAAEQAALELEDGLLEEREVEEEAREGALADRLRILRERVAHAPRESALPVASHHSASSSAHVKSSPSPRTREPPIIPFQPRRVLDTRTTRSSRARDDAAQEHLLFE
jgi:hypothetical protein